MQIVRWLRRSVFVLATIAVGLAWSARAQTPPTPAANPDLVAFLSQYQKPELMPIAKGVHLAFAYDFGNVMYAEGEDGVVVVDTGWAVERARASLAAYRAQVSRMNRPGFSGDSFS
jgi:alkyl sulfatase BDS1-like metallo-beta-lactamase superfamily hydrolase